MTLANLHTLQPHLDRLVTRVATDAGASVTVCSGDRVRFRYRDRERAGIVVGVCRGGFRMVEDGSGRIKRFRADRVSGFELLAAGTSGTF